MLATRPFLPLSLYRVPYGRRREFKIPFAEILRMIAQLLSPPVASLVQGGKRDRECLLITQFVLNNA
jgi:hypothetical protein